MSNDETQPVVIGVSVQEAGRRGGTKVAAKYKGTDFYAEIGRLGGQRTAAAHGPSHYAAIGALGGKKGGEATRDKHGSSHYEAIGRKGGAKVKALIAAGKAAQAAKP